MKRLSVTLCGISLAALLSSTAAFADNFTFNFSGSGFTGSGTFTATATSTAGQYLINSVSGTTDGTAIAGILAPGIYPPTSSGDFPNDNDLYYPLVAGGALDINGFSYSLMDGTDFNIYYYDGTYSLVTDPNLDAYNLDSFSIIDTTTGTPIVVPPAAATPEPTSLALLATAALGMAATIRRRFAD